jgi:dipeptidase
MQQGSTRKRQFLVKGWAKAALSAAVLLAVAAGGVGMASACTTFIAGRGVTTDGSRIIGRTHDYHDLRVTTVAATPAVNRKTPWTYVDGDNQFTVQLPAKSCAYIALPLSKPDPGKATWDEAVINEHHVVLTATESIYANKAALDADPYVGNGLEEGAIPTVVMPYVTTAREGVERLGKLMDTHGSAEGNAVVFADDNETWYMEMYTGHQWAAIRFPDDKYALIANDGMLGTIDINDKANVIASKNLVQLAKEHHFLQEENGRIHVAHTYAQAHRDYSQLRVWAAQRKLTPSLAKEYDVNTTYAMMLKPDKKISLNDAMELLRYRYEDTDYNVNTYPSNRAIGINRTAEAHLFWLRDNKPQIMWVALANPEMSVFVPFYGNVTKLPAAYNVATTDYNRDNAYYKFRRLSALAVQNRSGYGKTVRDYWHKMELNLIQAIPDMDGKYLQAGRSSEAANKLCGASAQAALDAADTLYQQTLTAFMLSTVQDGSSDAPATNSSTK